MRVFMGSVAMTLAALVVAAGHPSPAASKTLVKEGIGCASRTVFERINRLLDAGEREAFERVANEGVKANECLWLPKGFEIAIDDVVADRVCLRLTITQHITDVPCVWTWRDAVGN